MHLARRRRLVLDDLCVLEKATMRLAMRLQSDRSLARRLGNLRVHSIGIPFVSEKDGAK